MLYLCFLLLPVLCSYYLILLISLCPSLSAQNPMQNMNIDNFTTCEEFLKNSKLDLIRLVEEDWKIFYFWNQELENSYNIRFSMPSRMLVQRFEVELADDLKPPVNFSHAELFMETAIDFSALFIKTETPGLYVIIPNIAFEVKTAPLMKFALKIVEPGYLGIVNCKYRLCYGLAPVNNMPKHDEILEAAAKIGYRSDFGRSYLVQASAPEIPQDTQVRREEDDAEDDVQEGVEMKENELSLF